MSKRTEENCTKKLEKYHKQLQDLQNIEDPYFQAKTSHLFSKSPIQTQNINIFPLLTSQSTENPPQTTQKFNPNLNYQKQCSNLELTIQQNLNFLKDISLVSNLYETLNPFEKKSIPEIFFPNLINKNPDFELPNIKRSRRKNNDILKQLECPFLNCVKNYGSRTALKLHIKRNHKINDQTKNNLKKSLTSIVTSTSTKGVDFDRVISKKFKKNQVGNGFGIEILENPVFGNCDKFISEKKTEADEFVNQEIVLKNAELK